MADKFVHKLSIAQAVLQANLTTDEEAAKAHGVHPRTIEKWRAKMNTDPDFVAALQVQRQLLNEMFMGKLTSALSMTVGAVYRLVNEIVTNPTLLAKAATDPVMLQTLVSSVERLATVQMAERIMDVRLRADGGEIQNPPVDTTPPPSNELKSVGGGTTIRRLAPGIVVEES